jgi:hypothetical protein
MNLKGGLDSSRNGGVSEQPVYATGQIITWTSGKIQNFCRIHRQGPRSEHPARYIFGALEHK